METDHSFYLARVKVENDIQQNLAILDEVNYDENIDFFKSLDFYFSYFIIREIFHFVSLRPKNNVIYAKLVKMLEDNNSNTIKIFNKTISKMLNHPFVRILYDLGCFTLEEMEIDEQYEHFADVIPDYYSFIPPELQDSEALKCFYVTKEWVYEGYNRLSLEYFLKYDDIDSFQQNTIQEGFNFMADAYQGRFINLFSTIESKSRSIMNTFQNKDYNYLELSSFYGSIKCFKFLLMNGCDISQHAFNCAFVSGEVEIVRLCIQKAFEVTNYQAQIASIYFRNELENWMHESYDILTIEPTNIRRIINIADLKQLSKMLGDLIDYEYFDVARLFISRGCTTNILPHIETPLSIASRKGNIQVVKYLIQHGAKPSLVSVDYPVYPVLQAGSFQVFTYLRDKWFDFKKTWPQNKSMLIRLILYGDNKTISEAIKMKLSCEEKDLISAVKKNNIEAFKYIYENYASFSDSSSSSVKTIVSSPGIQITKPNQQKKSLLQVQKANKESISIQNTSKINDIMKVSLILALKKGYLELVDYILSIYNRDLPIIIGNIPKHKIEEAEALFNKHKFHFEISSSCSDRYLHEYFRKKGMKYSISAVYTDSFDDLFSLYTQNYFSVQLIRGKRYEMTDSIRSLFQSLIKQPDS